MTLSRDRTGLTPDKTPDWKPDSLRVPPGSEVLTVRNSAQGVETYAEMLTQCVGSAPKIFFLGASEINNGDPAQYFYDGDGGVWWAAMVKVN